MGDTMDNKVLVNLYVSELEKEFEIFLPANKTIGEIIILISKALYDFSNGYYNYKNTERIYNKETREKYDLNIILKDSTIRNGSELIFI